MQTTMLWAAGLISLGLIIYLFYVLLNVEEF